MDVRYRTLGDPDGTNRLQRTPPALERDYIRPDERDLSGLLEYARNVARELRFHNVGGQPTGDWAAMFDTLIDPGGGRILPQPRLDALLAGADSWSPHLALFVAFLRNFHHLQEDLNALPHRHLGFYYRDFLRVARKRQLADRVHVLFQLAGSAESHRLAAGTLLEGGKDAQGSPLTYALEREVVVTQAAVARIYRLIAERDKNGRRRFFKSEHLPEAGSWPTFGSSQFNLAPPARTMQEVDQGFALGSPILRLAEGQRRIVVRAALEARGTPPASQNLGLYVRVDLSGDEGWFAPQVTQVSLQNTAEGLHLTVDARIAENQPAIVDFSAGLHGAVPAGPWPVLRCLVRSESGRLETLEGLAVSEVEIEVSANGVRDLVFQNDQGMLTAGKPILPFGSHPRIGSNFYIGSHEIFSKRLTELKLRMQWQDLPDDLLDHYREYFDFHDSNLGSIFRGSFDMTIDLLDGRSWNHPLTAPQSLFGPGTDRMIDLEASAFTSAFGSEAYTAQPNMPAGPYDAKTRRGFIRLRLNGPTEADLDTGLGVPYALEVPFKAFGHDAFPLRYARQAMALARWDGTGTEPALPNEPYTPTLASLTVDYRSTARFAPGDIQAHERFYTIGPFGHTTAPTGVSATLVPEFTGHAALYLGIDGFKPPGDVSLLFKLDEGTATVPQLLATPDVTWRYLSAENWIELPVSALRGDETLGFQQAGVINVSIGKDASHEHTAMPAGLVWLQAVIDKSPQSAARTRALHAQAATATFAPETGRLEDFDAHLGAGVPAGTLTKLKPRQGAVKKVEQPYPSFGGRGSEADREYFERTSERLRHRRRAVTTWDFERLVLDAFPEVFKVNCLPHRDASAGRQVGDLALVILPNLRNSDVASRLAPRAGEVLMEKIRGFLSADLATPFANVHVIHPVYERVLVDARVAFRPGFDAGYYAERLNEDLQRFLSPWAFEDGQDIVFGARIYRSQLLKFMEDRDYVDYVTRFDLYHSFEGPPRHGIGFMQIGFDFVVGADPKPTIGPATGGMKIGVDFVVGRGVESAATTQPHALLVSHSRHRIEPVIPGTEQCTGVSRLGIGYMAVSLDFQVHPF